MSIRDKVEERLDLLESQLKEGKHLDPLLLDSVNDNVDDISKFWSILSPDDRDYINSARLTIKNQWVWK